MLFHHFAGSEGKLGFCLQPNMARYEAVARALSPYTDEVKARGRSSVGQSIGRVGAVDLDRACARLTVRSVINHAVDPPHLREDMQLKKKYIDSLMQVVCRGLAVDGQTDDLAATPILFISFMIPVRPCTRSNRGRTSLGSRGFSLRQDCGKWRSYTTESM